MFSFISALFLFTFVMAITPGPNNLLCLSMGLNFGFRKTIPFMAGITSGVCVVIILVVWGLSTVFELFPIINTLLKWLASGYIIYLAWKIFNIKGTEDFSKPDNDSTLLGFWNGSLMQLINPKVWICYMSGTSIYISPSNAIPFETQCSIYLVIGFFLTIVCLSLWSAAGALLMGVLKKYTRWVNIGLALLLLMMLIPLFLWNN